MKIRGKVKSMYKCMFVNGHADNVDLYYTYTDVHLHPQMQDTFL